MKNLEPLAGNLDERHKITQALMLQIIDHLWKEHLTNMDGLRQGVTLRSYAQKNPIQEYQRESFDMFGDLLKNIKLTVIGSLARMEIKPKAVEAADDAPTPKTPQSTPQTEALEAQ